MEARFEERIITNPLLGAIAIWEFVHKYETHRPPKDSPSLLFIVPVLPLVLHRPAAKKLKTMRFESGLGRFLADDPSLLANLQPRIASLGSLTFQSLTLACSSGLLEGVREPDRLFFRSKAQSLPEAIQPEGIANTIALAARRLGAFFRDETVLQLEAKLRIFL